MSNLRLLLLLVCAAVSAQASILSPVYITGTIGAGFAHVVGEDLLMQGGNYAAFVSPGTENKPLPPLTTTLAYDVFANACSSPIGCDQINIQGQIGWVGDLTLHQVAGGGWIGTYSVFAGIPGFPLSFQFVDAQAVIAASVTPTFGIAPNGQQGVLTYIIASPEPSTWLLALPALTAALILRRRRSR